ncbi:MAG: hypothetical protein EOO01_19685 [Chitinophagaceae bacterium]|nr:MAG: hypothetical protein EOO01_19685 [Chitinophagaceae bacterium]
MYKYAKILLLCTVLGGSMYSSFADRGIGKKKNKVTLNVATSPSFKKSLPVNLRNGLKFTGSLTVAPPKQTTSGITSTSLVTYQKGNSIYIVPFKQKVVVTEVRPGYTGMKLVIQTP